MEFNSPTFHQPIGCRKQPKEEGKERTSSWRRRARLRWRLRESHQPKFYRGREQSSNATRGGSIREHFQLAPVAQLAEHWTFNPGVVGSNPTGGTKDFDPGLC